MYRITKLSQLTKKSKYIKQNTYIINEFDGNKPMLFLESSVPTHVIASFSVKDVISTLPDYRAGCETNSLEILLPKSALACDIISRGSRL